MLNETLITIYFITKAAVLYCAFILLFTISLKEMLKLNRIIEWHYGNNLMRSVEGWKEESWD